jgi:hypothetical protein
LLLLACKLLRRYLPQFTRGEIWASQSLYNSKCQCQTTSPLNSERPIQNGYLVLQHSPHPAERAVRERNTRAFLRKYQQGKERSVSKCRAANVAPLSKEELASRLLRSFLGSGLPGRRLMVKACNCLTGSTSPNHSPDARMKSLLDTRESAECGVE